MTYEELLNLADGEKIEVLENYIGKFKGLYIDETITLNSNLHNDTERRCVIAEELGHYYKTHGDILDQTKIENRKQERVARAWGYENLISLVALIEAKKEGIRNRYELAEYLEITEGFLDNVLKYYKEKYGNYYLAGNYVIEFEPLEVYERINFNLDTW